MKKLDPKLAEAVMLEAGLVPLEPYPGGGKKWKSRHIKCGEIVFPRYDKIIIGQRGCKSCGYTDSGNKRKINSKAAVEIMRKAKLKPLEPYKNASTPWSCECLICGKRNSPTLASVKKGSGCRNCGFKKTSSLKKISQSEAIALMINANLHPLEPYKGANTPWKCKCLHCGKIIKPTYGTIQQGGKCEYCAKTKVDPKDAIKIMLASKLKPLEPYEGAHKKWKCIHSVCGAIVYPRYSDVKKGNGGCNPCAKKNSLNYKRIPSKMANSLMRANGMEPLEPFVDTSKKWKCRCLKCGKISHPRYSSVKSGRTCVYCAGNRVDPEDAIKIMSASRLKPLEPYKSALSKWKCRCLKCGKIVYPQFSSVQNGQGGCRFCAVKGINMNTPSYVYLITNYNLNAHKVGMGNHKKTNDRLGKFIKTGWETYRVWQTATGAEAIDIETQVLKILRKDLKLPIYLSKSDMPKTEGHTETVGADSITLLKLEKIINKVIRGYSQ
jgi:hypothetical protein